MSKLKRCPFCDAEMESSNNQYYFHPDNDCILHGFGFADRRSIKAWNTRKPMQNIVERLEKELEMTEWIEFEERITYRRSIKIVKEEGEIDV